MESMDGTQWGRVGGRRATPDVDLDLSSGMKDPMDCIKGRADFY